MEKLLQGGGGTIIWIVLMVAIFYFLIIRPQKKREKKDRELRNSVQAGDKIVTIGGFVGRVLSVKDDTVTFETGADRTKLTIKKWAIQSRTTPEQEKKEEASTEAAVIDGKPVDK